MKIINPLRVDKDAADKALADTIGAKLQTYFAANTDKKAFGLLKLKTALPEHAQDLTHAMLSLIAERKGWQLDIDGAD